MRLPLTALMLYICALIPATAQSALVDRYFETLQMEEVFVILRQEGISAGEQIALDDGDVATSPAWSARLADIYRTTRMREVFAEEIGAVSDLEASLPALEFFETELGQRIIEIELAARRALADDSTKEALDSRVERMMDDEAGRVALYQEFIEVNDLVESNVSGALNSNLAFYRGMATNDQYRQSLNEGFILTTVWQQEPEIRAETESWTLGFSALAYDTLSDAEMQQYIDLSATEAGQKLNAALFAGFDRVFELQSFDLGQATAEFSAGEDT